MKIRDLVRDVVVEEVNMQVSIGDVVWWFGQAQTSDLPLPATVVMFGEDNMVNLTYQQPHTGRSVAIEGVCLCGDPRLKNPNYNKRGAWCPRGTWSFLGLKD